jgi:hypothetical protein
MASAAHFILITDAKPEMQYHVKKFRHCVNVASGVVPTCSIEEVSLRGNREVAPQFTSERGHSRWSNGHEKAQEFPRIRKKV